MRPALLVERPGSQVENDTAHSVDVPSGLRSLSAPGERAGIHRREATVGSATGRGEGENPAVRRLIEVLPERTTARRRGDLTLRPTGVMMRQGRFRPRTKEVGAY